MNAHSHRRIAAALLLATLFIGVLSFGMTGGNGIVLNASTNQPVAAATVKLECKEALLDGTRVLKVLQATTDDEGRFSFAFSDVWRCDSALVRAEKDGFVDTSRLDIRYDYTSYERIPRRLHLTPRGEERLQRLKYHAAMSASRGSNPTHQYFLVYEAFIQAKGIAQTESEREFVKNKFCGRLSALNEGLSDAQRAELRGPSWNTAVRHVPIDHQAHVSSYCAARFGAKIGADKLPEPTLEANEAQQWR